MNYLMVIKEYIVNCMIENELLAEELRDVYYKLLIRVGEGKANHLNFRKFHGVIQRILEKNDNVSRKN